MLTGARVILFDIDGTLIERDRLLWTGGHCERWQRFCTELKDINAQQGYETHFGLATFKPQADEIYNVVMGLGEFADQSHLQSFISPDYIFFTSAQSKFTHALEPALAKLKAQYEGATRQDVFIIDDEYTNVLKEATEQGFGGFHAREFSKVTKRDQHAQIVSDFTQQVLTAFKQNDFSAPSPKPTTPPPAFSQPSRQWMSGHRTRK